MVVALILAAGYGTRLERDIINDSSGHYAHLRGVPKALIPVGGKPLLDFWISAFQENKDIVSNVYIVCNQRNYESFRQWALASDFPVEHLVNDGSTANENRRGAIADIEFVIKQKDVHEDLLVVAGDTLFFEDFKLRDVLERFKKQEGDNLITYYELSDHKEVSKRGIMELSEEGKVINFLEKPSPEQTSSNKASPPLYLYTKGCLPLFSQFISESGGVLAAVDAPGSFISWLYPRANVYAHPIRGRFDIGGLADYIETNNYFTRFGTNNILANC